MIISIFAVVPTSLAAGSAVLLMYALLFSTSTVVTVSSDKLQRLLERIGYQAGLPEFHCGG
jgi:hypothetical protein